MAINVLSPIIEAQLRKAVQNKLPLGGIIKARRNFEQAKALGKFIQKINTAGIGGPEFNPLNILTGQPLRNIDELKKPKNPTGSENFMATLRSRLTDDFARPNRFKVTIVTPPALSSGLEAFGLDSQAARKISFDCSDALFPGENIATNEVKYVGVIRKFPYVKNFNDIVLTFYVDPTHRVQLFFQAWQNLVIGQDAAVGYYDDYVGKIFIEQLHIDDIELPTFTKEIGEAFPTSFSAIALGMGISNAAERLTVSFSWR